MKVSVKILPVYAAIFMFGVINAYSQAPQNVAIVHNFSVANSTRTVENKAFNVGEKLSFDIYWEFVKVGSADLSINKILNYNNREVFEVESRVASNSIISSIYKVDNMVKSYIDAEGIYSHKLEKRLREGSYKADRLFLFDQENNIAISEDDTLEIPENCQDILSSFYYLRTLDLEVGKSYDIPNYDNGKIYYLNVKVLKRQTVRVPAGKFKCLVIEPTLKGEGLFKNEGRMKIYLTDDERKIPVILASKVKFGDVVAKLRKIEK